MSPWFTAIAYGISAGVAGAALGAAARHIQGFVEGHPWWEDPIGNLQSDVRNFGTGAVTGGLAHGLGTAFGSALGSQAAAAGAPAGPSATIGQAVPKVVETAAKHGIESVGTQVLNQTGSTGTGALTNALANAGTNAATGALGGAVNSAAQGGDVRDVLRGAASGAAAGGVRGGLSSALAPTSAPILGPNGSGIGSYGNDAQYAGIGDNFVGPSPPPENPIAGALSRAYGRIQLGAGDVANAFQHPTQILDRATQAFPRLAGGLAGTVVNTALTPPPVSPVPPPPVTPFPSAQQNPFIRRYY